MQLYNCKKAASLKIYIFVKKQPFYVRKQSFLQLHNCKKSNYVIRKQDFLHKSCFCLTVKHFFSQTMRINACQHGSHEQT